MFLVQAALALALFATVMGVGVGEAVKYAQARLPYTIAQNVVNAASFISNAVGSYCLQANAPNPCNPTLNNLQSSGYVPSVSPNGTYALPDGSSIALGNYGPGNTYGMRIGLGSVLASNNNYGKIVMNRIPGSFAPNPNNINSIHVSQPLPAVASIMGQFVRLNPTTSLQTVNNGDLLMANGGVQANQGVATNDISGIAQPNGRANPYIDFHNSVLKNTGGVFTYTVGSPNGQALSVLGNKLGSMPIQENGGAGWSASGGGSTGVMYSGNLCLYPQKVQNSNNTYSAESGGNQCGHNGGTCYFNVPAFVLVPC